MLHGCVPVVINDGVDQVFATILDWDDFAVQIPEVRSEISCWARVLLTLPCMQGSTVPAGNCCHWRLGMNIRMDMQDEMDFLPEILLSVSPSRLQQLQIGVRRVWHRFMYKAFTLFQRELLSLGAVDQQPALGQYASQIDPRLLAQIGEDDAFATIMQWLYERMIQET